jgi:hypothetical protein
MWDPQKSGSELLRQYTKGMFGKENEEKLASVLEAVEASCCYLCPGLQAPYELSFILNDAADRLELIRRAKRTIADVRISADFVPAFPLIIEPEDLIKEIAAQLDVIEPYLQFHVAAADLLLMKEKGASEAEISRAFEALPKVSGSNEYLNRNVPGRYFFDLQKLRKELGLGKK